MNECYGTTEAGPISVNGRLEPYISVRLIDVPELSYFSTDSPPRGELWVKSTKPTSPGYFQDQENTSATFGEDGWIATGDIVEYMDDSRRIRIIDRKKNVFKLAQGEFVAPEKLENLFIKSPFIRNCLVYGNGKRDYVLAAVDPDTAFLRKWVKEHPLFAELVGFSDGGKIEEIYDNSEVNRLILEDIQMIALKEGLRKFETPQGLLISSNEWTIENRFLTPSFKTNRLVLCAHFKTQFEDLYVSLENAMTTKIKKILEDTLGAQEEPQSLVSLGIDSVSALRIRALLKTELNIDVPITHLLNPQTTAEEIHKVPNIQNKSIEGDLELPEDIIQILRSAPKFGASPEKLRSIFLTGANGFVGAFLLSDLIQRTDAIIFCLVRSSSTHSGKEKLYEALKSFELTHLLDLFDSRILVSLTHHVPSSFNHDQVVQGELGDPLFGLTKNEFMNLCGKVDLIVHNGALVNAVLSYEHHRPANVLGMFGLTRAGTGAFTSHF